MTSSEDYFRTDAVRAELKHRTVRSGAIAASARGAQILLQLGSAMVLARLLTPEDFGVQAMVLPLTILINSIANLGLQTAVIQREQLDHAQASAMFWLALKVNLGLTGLMALSAPLLALLYAEPRVTAVAVAWAAVIYGATLSVFHEALLKRQLRFGTVMTAQVVSLLVSIVVAVAAARAGAGYWALMIQIGVMELGRAAAMWLLCGWRPAAPVRRPGLLDGVRALRSYWAGLSGFRALSWAGDQLDRVVAGTVGGAPVLGLYDSAKRWAWFPFLELFLSLSDVAVSSFSRVQRNFEQYRAYVQYGLLAILTLSLPAIGFMFTDARNVLLVLLGKQWLRAEPFVRLMCLAAIGGCLSRPMQWVYLSRGDTRRQLRWMILYTPTMIIAVLAGSAWGPLGVATGFTVGTCALAIPSVAYALYGSPVRLMDLARVVGRPLLATVAAGIVVVAVGPALPGTGSPILALALRGPVFAVIYALAWMAQPGGVPAARELVRAVRELGAKSAAARGIEPVPDAPPGLEEI